MIQITTTTFKTLEDLHEELEGQVLVGAGRSLSDEERITLAILAGTLARAFDLPQEEFEKLLPDFRDAAYNIGERLSDGMAVSEAVVQDTPYCVQKG